MPGIVLPPVAVVRGSSELMQRSLMDPTRRGAPIAALAIGAITIGETSKARSRRPRARIAGECLTTAGMFLTHDPVLAD